MVNNRYIAVREVGVIRPWKEYSPNYQVITEELVLIAEAAGKAGMSPEGFAFSAAVQQAYAMAKMLAGE